MVVDAVDHVDHWGTKLVWRTEYQQKLQESLRLIPE